MPFSQTPKKGIDTIKVQILKKLRMVWEQEATTLIWIPMKYLECSWEAAEEETHSEEWAAWVAWAVWEAAEPTSLSSSNDDGNM